jgi:hypothetical protein
MATGKTALFDDNGARENRNALQIGCKSCGSLSIVHALALYMPFIFWKDCISSMLPAQHLAHAE